MKVRILGLLLSLMLLLCACARTAPDAVPTDAPTTAPTSPTTPTEPTKPSAPTEPTEPEVLSEHQKLHRYIAAGTDRVNGVPARIEKKETYTFTMLAQTDGTIRWEYCNENITVGVTLKEGENDCPVDVSLAMYSGISHVDRGAYTDAEHQLKGFFTGAPDSIAESMKNQTATCVWICFMNAETQIVPADVTLTSLGFVSYYE